MLAIAAYESIENDWAAHDVAQAISDLSSTFPEIDQAHLTLAGAEAEKRMSVKALESFLTEHEALFAAALLCSSAIGPADGFLSSVPMIMIQNLSEVRGLYLIFELSALKRVAGNLIRCFDSLGEGFGYVAGTNHASGAMDYALDMDVLTDLDQIEAFLQPREGWREHLQSPSRGCQARNLYPINLWPKGFARSLQEEKCFTAALAAGEIRSLGGYENVDLFFAEPGASSALAPINQRFFLEGPGDMDLDWLEGRHADALRAPTS